MRVRLLTVALVLCLAQSLPTFGQPSATAPQAQLEAMEKKFFEHDFSKEPNEYRLGRLEKFAFGQTNTGTPDARLKKLSSVINLHANLVPQTGTPATQSKAAAPAPRANAESDEESGRAGRYPHITNLERSILKQTYEGEPIGNRLARLETRVFGETKPNQDLASRTDSLEQFAEKTLHQKAYAINPDNDDDQVLEIRPTRKRLGEPMQSIAALPGDPSAADDAEDAPRPIIDPAVLAATPPDSHARLLTRVAWCEQHLFGHTSPNLHLQQRLHQINTILNPNDHEPDIKLMDRVDLLVKEVVMRQHPPLATASAAGFSPQE